MLKFLTLHTSNQYRKSASRRAILNVQNLAPSEIEIMYCNYVVCLVFYLDFSHKWNSTASPGLNGSTPTKANFVYKHKKCTFRLIQKSFRSLLFKKLGKIKYSLENIFVVPDQINDIDHIRNSFICKNNNSNNEIELELYAAIIISKFSTF